MRPAVTVIVSAGDDTSKVELEAALRKSHPEIPVVDLGGLAPTEVLEIGAVRESAYVWFLTPDSLPGPHCLDELLDAISATESIAAVGPKIMREDRIVSAGVTTTSAGVRVNPLGTGEVDQGQRDGETEALGLDLPGLLIATSELEKIGLPSRALGLEYRGIEYSRRLRDLGKRVVLAPRATITVGAAQAMRLGSSAHPPLSKFQLRSEQRYRLSLPSPGFAVLMVQLFLTRLGSALMSLLANDVRSAAWYFAALAGLGADARSTAGLRRANARRNRIAKRTGSAHVATLFADSSELAVQRRSMYAEEDARGVATGGAGTTSSSGLLDESDLHQVGDTEEELDSFSRLEISGGPGLLRHPLTLLILAAAVMSGFFSFRLFGPGHLTAGALGDSAVSAREVFSRLLSQNLDVSTTAAVPADPYHLLIGVLSLPFLGNVDIMLRTLILVAPIAAVIAAYACSGRIVSKKWIRALAGLLWIASPVFTTALSTGRVGVILVWIAAPLFVLSLRRSLRSGSVAAAATGGLLVFVMVAGVPFALLLAILLAVVLVLRGSGLRHLWLLVPTLVLAWPWLWALLGRPGALFTMPGQTLSPPAPPTYLLALGFPGSFDLGWLSRALERFGASGIDLGQLQTWVPALALPMLVLAFFTLIEARLKLRRLMWAVGLYVVGLLLATAQILIPAQVGPFSLIGSYPAAGLLLLSLGATMMLAMGAERTTASQTSARRLPMRGLAGLVAVAAVALIVLAAGQASTSADAVRTTERGSVPALAADRASGPTQARTLRLDDVDGEVLVTLISTADGSVLGTSTIRSAEAVGGWHWERRPLPIAPNEVLVAQSAAALSADDAGDVRALLGELGVDFVLVDNDALGLQNSVAAAAGLVEVGPTESGVLWRVDKPYSGRFLIRDAEGGLSDANIRGATIDIPAGEDGRTLLVANDRDTVSASLDGRPLPGPAEPSTDWAAEYSLPTEGGRVELSSGSAVYAPGVVLGWILGLFCLLVAIPFGTGRQHAGPNRISSPEETS